MYAIVETGGKQYRAAVGEVLQVEKLGVDEGTEVTFDRVLLVTGEGGTRVGRPYVEGAVVKAEVTENDRAKKILIFKKRRRKNYARRQGHRQYYTRVRITAIEG